MKIKYHLPFTGALLFLLVAIPAVAQQPEGMDPATRALLPGDVRQPALSASLQPAGGVGQVVITKRSFRQIFEPYLFHGGPAFVTADAVLQAFHVLLAQSLGRFEKTGTPRLVQALRLMHRQVATTETEPQTGRSQNPGSPAGQADELHPAETGYQDLSQRARQRARIVVSVALELIGAQEAALDADIASIVETEVRRVEEAEGTRLPEWFGNAGALQGGIDYAGFRPRGFYLQSETLKRYFRTVRWLQSIPFTVDSDEELLAILLLSKALTSTRREERDQRRAAENYLRCRRELFGGADDQDLLFAAGILKDHPADLDTVRQRLRSAGEVPANVRDRSVADPYRDVVYIISPSRLPDEAFLHRRRQSDGFTYTEPSGLEICALLGSAYARDQLELRLPPAYRQALQTEIDRFAGELARDSLYNQYLRTVAALLDPPEPDAPAFTGEPAWQAKSCNAALAGWVRERKLLPVTQRPPAEAIDDVFTEPPPGLVEPDPEFFGRLGELSERVANILDRCGALPVPAVELTIRLRQFDRLLAAGRYGAETDDAQPLTPEEQEVVETALTILLTLEGLRIEPTEAARRKEEIRSTVDDVADALARGAYDQDPTYQALVIESGMDLARRWQQLQAMCRRLEVMAHKQLRGVAFNRRETYFLGDFGNSLASVMLYGGDSYRRPRDDAPVAFTFFFDPRSEKHLHAAVARPREIMVGYPAGGRQIACRGAVVPYYEFVAASDFTDEQWRRRLDGDERPSPLRWLDPVMQVGEPQKSWLRIETPGAETLPDRQ